MSIDQRTSAWRRIDDVAVGEPTGQLRIRAGRLDGRTVITDLYRTAPFHLGLPSDRADDGAVELIVQGVGPGYLPGDRLAVDIRVGVGAALTVRGQGATKVFSSPAAVPVVADVGLSVEADGRLTYLPGELIPYRQSVLAQRTRIEVAAGGRLALGEVLTPGRVAMGEANVFTRLHLEVEASYAGRTCLIERARLDPVRRPLTSMGRHGDHPIAGALYLIGVGWRLPDAPATPESITWAAAEGDGYTLVRLLGPTAQAVAAAMRTLLEEKSPSR